MAGFLSGLSERMQTNRPRLLSGLRNNANAMLGFASGVFGGQGPSAIGQGLQGFMQGGQFDRQAAMDTQAEKDRQIQQANEARRQEALAIAIGGMEGLPPELANLYEVMPESALPAIADYYTPDPVESFDYPDEYDQHQQSLIDPEFAAWLQTQPQQGGDLPTSVQEYEYGLLNPDFAKQQAIERNGGGPLVENIFPGDEIATEEDLLRAGLVETDAARWTKFSTQGTVAANAAMELELLAELSTLAPEGPIVGALAQAFPGFSTAGDAFMASVNRIVPTLRVEGSGATSDLEYQGMQRGMPQLKNTDEARQAIIAVLMAKADVDMDRAAVVLAFQNRQITLEDARMQIAEIDRRSIMTPEIRRVLGLDGASPAGVDDPLGIR
jgi:hypothetical protein